MNMDGATINDIQHAAHKLRVSDSPIKVATTTSSEFKGTMYITVGPQCAGKTTTLRKIFGNPFQNHEDGMPDSELAKDTASMAGIDITIDDQALVYIPVPTNYFLPGLASNLETEDGGASHLPLHQVIFDKTIEERIRDPSNQELTLVVQRFKGVISAEEFALRLVGDRINDTTDTVAREDLVSAVEHMIQSQQCRPQEKADDEVPFETLPKKIDLFIVESVFRPRPLEMIQMILNEDRTPTHSTSSSSLEAFSAIDHARNLLKEYATNSHIHSPMASISWGNTNTRPREFEYALECAAMSGRPVEFIVFGGMEACNMIRDHVSRREYLKSHGNEEISADALNDTSNLPKVDRRTLFVRNLQRFLKTGRYIPSNAIADAMVRVESMLSQAVAEAKKKVCPTDEDDSVAAQFCSAKFRLDFELAKLAGYHMKADRTVSKVRDESIQSIKRNQSIRNDYRNQRAGRYHGRSSTNGGRGGRFGSSQAHKKI